MSESAKFLSSIYEQLFKKIESGAEEVLSIGSLEDFNRRNSKNRLLTIEQIFGLGLKSFPNVGKQTVSNLLRFFKSYRILYDKLS